MSTGQQAETKRPNWVEQQTQAQNDRGGDRAHQQQQQQQRDRVRSIVNNALGVDEFLALVPVPAEPWRGLLRLADYADGATTVETGFSTVGMVLDGANPKQTYTQAELRRYGNDGRAWFLGVAQWQDENGWLLVRCEKGGMDRDGCQLSSIFHLPVFDVLAEAYDVAQLSHLWRKGRRPEALRKALVPLLDELHPTHEADLTNTLRPGVLLRPTGGGRKPRKPVDVILGALAIADRTAAQEELTEDEWQQIDAAQAQLAARRPRPPNPGNGSEPTAPRSESSAFDGGELRSKGKTSESQGGGIASKQAPGSGLYKREESTEPEPEKPCFSNQLPAEFPKKNPVPEVLPAPFQHPPAPRLEFSSTPIADALRAGEATQAAGCERFLVTIKDDRHGRTRSYDTYDADRLGAELPKLLARTADERLSLIVRVCGADGGRILLRDDLTEDERAQWEPFAFMTSETSPGSFQALIALPNHEDGSTLLRIAQALDAQAKALGSKANAGSFGAIRWPGSINAKGKHQAPDGSYPRVRLVSLAIGRVVWLSELVDAGLLASMNAGSNVDEENQEAPPGFPADLLAGKWDGTEPSYKAMLANCGIAEHGGPDRNVADLMWVESALARGMPDATIIERLGQLSEKAQARAPRSRHRYCVGKLEYVRSKRAG